MNRIIVIGCPGSGKSTFSRELHRITNIPLVHLDMLYWNADRTAVDRSVFMEKLGRTLELGEWIIDGNYGSTMEMRFSACDTVFFLDYPVEVCLSGIDERMGKARTDMPWVETEPDYEFIGFVKNYESVSRPRVLELIEKYCDKTTYVFKSREEAGAFLQGLKNN